MDRATFRFRLFGFPVEVLGSFWLLVAFYAIQTVPFGISLTLGWVVALFVGILVHELGHALAARVLRVEVGTIQLWGLGGLVSHGAATPGRQLLISLAGPLAGVVFGLLWAGVAVAAHAPPDLQRILVEPMVWVTVVYGVFNLLPALPLDGGHALEAALTPLFRSAAKARRVAAVLGLVVAAGLVFAMVYSGDWFALIPVYLLVVVNWPIAQGTR